VVLVLEGVAEPRRHAFFGTLVADPAAVVDQARQCFKLILAADDALEVGFRHGGLVGVSVGLGDGVGGLMCVGRTRERKTLSHWLALQDEKEREKKREEKRCCVVSGEKIEKDLL
jgi:hypothetical protein